MPPDPERETWPDAERRTGNGGDTGKRRRITDRTDYTIRDLVKLLEAHEDESREWRARQSQRMESVERRADLLDGSAGNDGGIIGQLGELKGQLEAARSDLRDLKNKTGAQDGQKPASRLERVLTVAGPILVVLITTAGGIVIAILALKGQLAGLNSGGPRP